LSYNKYLKLQIKATKLQQTSKFSTWASWTKPNQAYLKNQNLNHEMNIPNS
jgi:hypothetical protein